jgi:hypothetical protein
MTTLTVGGHALTRATEDGITEMACECGQWVALGHTDAELVWIELAHQAHLEGIVEERSAGLPEGVCHVECFDGHGHTDGCIYEAGEAQEV